MCEYIIINKTSIQKRIEELEEEQKQIDEETQPISLNINLKKLILLRKILSQSTPLIPEIEKAMDIAREIKDDSEGDTFTVEDVSGCTEVCTYGWRYKIRNEEYISNLKLDI